DVGHGCLHAPNGHATFAPWRTPPFWREPRARCIVGSCKRKRVPGPRPTRSTPPASTARSTRSRSASPDASTPAAGSPWRPCERPPRSGTLRECGRSWTASSSATDGSTASWRSIRRSRRCSTSSPSGDSDDDRAGRDPPAPGLVYNAYYGLREAPFQITPDPRFLFFSDQHREAFHHVLYGIQERKGFIQLTGEVGAGKTTVCRAILRRLGPQYRTALILNPILTSAEFFRSLLVELGLAPGDRDRAQCLELLNGFLLEQSAAGNDVVLVIDEAQDLDRDLLEHVRLLSNL